jgi:hypothetical protein
MFQGLINNAKSAVSGLVLKYVARASVAVPFVIALGFALAALTASARSPLIGLSLAGWRWLACLPPSSSP